MSGKKKSDLRNSFLIRKKPTLNQLKKRPAFWLSKTMLGQTVWVSYPDNKVERLGPWDQDWTPSTLIKHRTLLKKNPQLYFINFI